jgi:hypothetical protein
LDNPDHTYKFDYGSGRNSFVNIVTAEKNRKASIDFLTIGESGIMEEMDLES